MAIYDHPNSKSKRVVVSVGGEIRQAYFSIKDIDKADKWEQEQLKAQAAHKRKAARLRNKNSKGNPETATGVEGLRIGIKTPTGREKTYRCVIVVNVTSVTEEKRIHRKFVVTKLNLTSNWYAACKVLAHHLDRSSIPKQWLDQCPKPSQFNAMIKLWSTNNWPRDPGFTSLPVDKYPSHKWSTSKTGF